jgi:hypothetical protein
VNKADHFREAEIALGTESREQAEAELKNVGAERLAATLTEFIEWRAFSCWLRLCVESAGSSGCAFSSGRTKGFLQILSLRTGATRSVIMRHETGRPPIQIGWFLRMYYASSSRLGCLMNQTAAFFFRRIKWN